MQTTRTGENRETPWRPTDPRPEPPWSNEGRSARADAEARNASLRSVAVAARSMPLWALQGRERERESPRIGPVIVPTPKLYRNAE